MRRLVAAAVLAAGGVAAGTALAQTPGSAAEARLQGAYLVNGIVTHAVGVPGEHPGQHVSRTWTFTPTCPAGPCPTVMLSRQRAGGTDQVLLQAQGPGYYTGSASFLAPVRCRRRRWNRGELVPFRIAVRITAAEIEGTVTVATGFSATYYNRRRIGLTPCFSPPAHDSASYTGAPAPPPPA